MELNKKQKDSLFDALLRYAVKESAIQEINEMPTEEEIKKEIQFSESFESRMNTFISKRKSKRAAKKVLSYGKRIAVFVSVIISISFSTLMTAEAVQKAWYYVKKKYKLNVNFL